MAFIVSLALTALLISPVFMLAGWSRPAPQTLKTRFKAVNNQ